MPEGRGSNDQFNDMREDVIDTYKNLERKYIFLSVIDNFVSVWVYGSKELPTPP